MKNKTLKALDIIDSSGMELIEWTSNWYKSFGYWWRDCYLRDKSTDEHIYESIHLDETND